MASVKNLTNSDTVIVGNFKIDYNATLDLINKELVFNAYITSVLYGKQVGVLIYKTGKQFYHTYDDERDVSWNETTEIFSTIIGLIKENNEELEKLTVEE